LYETEAINAANGEMVMLCLGADARIQIERFRAMYPNNLLKLMRTKSKGYQCFVGGPIDDVPAPVPLEAPTGKLKDLIESYLREVDTANSECEKAVASAIERKKKDISDSYEYCAAKDPKFVLYASKP
jgi:hypothetical protein